MSIKILINAVDPEECRIAKVKESKLEDFHIESAAREITHGNIYNGTISRVEPSLQAVFVDYGGERNGFLQQHEIHSDYFLDSRDGGRLLKNLVKPGQEILVQVTKDPILSKGAMLTTFISLPGRYAVLTPGSETIGISRKIEEEDERKRLKKIATDLKLPEGFGLIIRTAGDKSTKTKISKDVQYLLRLWRNIKKKAMREPAPALLYKDRSIVVRAIRDDFTMDVKGILVDNEAVYKEVKDFVKIISPKDVKMVTLHKSDKPIFTKYQLEDQIASIFESRVSLKSGGSIVIQQTEALVSIDVNSGKATQKGSVEDTALNTNLEAAEEIARQLRLRDLGGLIVIDFIDMRERRHKLDVERTIKNHLKADKARTTIGKITRFGLLEMSRQRLRPSIEYGSFETCRHCHGKGQTLSKEALALGFLRKLRLETYKPDIASVKGVVPTNVADYLLNHKRREITELEQRRGISIWIEGDATMVPGESTITADNG